MGRGHARAAKASKAMSGPSKSSLYRTAQWIFRWGFRLTHGWRVEGQDQVPPSGGCLLAANHLSLLDPPALGSALEHRQVHFMAKQELFQRPLLGRLIRALGSFPVERGQVDRQALRQALELLKRGSVVGIFPEGTRGPGGPEMLPWHPGIALLAHQAQVPIVPVALRWQPLWIRFGAPRQVPEQGSSLRERLRQTQEQVETDVAALLYEMHARPSR